MIIEIPEQLISLVPLVQNLRCRFDPFPDLEIPAAVKEIGTEASETTRTYPVTLIMDQPEDVRILPGMTGEATGRAVLPDQPDVSAFEIPTTALFTTDGDATFVWLIDEASMVVTRREVSIDRTTPHGILVSGVDAGELIATAGVHYLREGQKVRIMDEETTEASP
jgi:multidrug efflux pump subunit AcrA (membrane-fusion protein)